MLTASQHKPIKFEVTALRGNLSDFHPNLNDELRYHAAIMVGNRVFIVEKLNLGTANENSYNCCYLDTTSWTWVWLEVSGPTFYLQQAVLVDDCILVYGNDNLPGAGVAHVWKLDLACLAWQCSELQTLPVAPTFMVCEFIECIRRVVFYGGVSADGLRDENTLLLIDVDTHSWTKPRETGARPTPRRAHMSCVLTMSSASTVFVFGGRHGNRYLNDLYTLEVRVRVCRWSQVLVTLESTPVSSAALACTNNTLFIFGGFDDHLEDVNDFVSYNLKNQKWSNIKSGSGSFKLEKDLQSTSAHRLLPYKDGLLVVGGFGRRFPWVDVLTAK